MKNSLRNIKFSAAVLLFTILLGTALSMAVNSGPIGFSLAIILMVFAITGMLPVGTGIDNLNIEDTTWSGPALDYMITRAVTDVDTIIKGCATVVEEVSRKQITIPRLEVTVLMQKYTPDPTAKGGQTVDGRVLTLQKFEMYDEFDPQDYEQHFFEQDFAEDALIDETLPATAENFTMLQYMKRINKWIEDSLWNSRLMWDPTGANVAPVTKGYGDNTLQTGTNYFFDGFLYKLLNDATVQSLTYNPANFTAANFRGNVLTPMLNTIINNPISKALAYKYGPEGLRFLESYADQALYEEALRTDSFKNQDSTQTAINRYRGYDMVPLAGLDEGTVVLSIARPDRNSNFWVGINSTVDFTLRMGKKPNPSKMWYVDMIGKIDVNHGFGDQAVVCTPITK